MPKMQVEPLSANPTKWSDTRIIRWLLPMNCLSVFDHFVGLALKGLRKQNSLLLHKKKKKSSYMLDRVLNAPLILLTIFYESFTRRLLFQTVDFVFFTKDVHVFNIIDSWF